MQGWSLHFLDPREEQRFAARRANLDQLKGTAKVFLIFMTVFGICAYVVQLYGDLCDEVSVAGSAYDITAFLVSVSAETVFYCCPRLAFLRGSLITFEVYTEILLDPESFDIAFLQPSTIIVMYSRKVTRVEG